MRLFFIILIILFRTITMLGTNYASMYIANGSSDLISGTLTAGTELQITGYSNMNSSGWTFASDKLTAGTNAAGNYLLRYSLSFYASVGLWTIKVYNGTTLLSEVTTKRKIGSSDVGNVSASGLVSVSAGDIIKIVAVCDVDATVLSIHQSQLTITPIKSSASSYVGEMYIYDNSTSQSVGSSWVTTENFTKGKTNGFIFSSSNNSLTTPDDGAGYYYVCFSVSFNASAANNTSFAMAVNGTVQSNLSLERRISGKADRGNAVFCGIIYLNNNDEITIKLKTDGATLDIKPYYSNLTLYELNLNNNTSYGTMCISGNTNSLNLQTSWVVEDDFTSGNLNSNWSSNSSSLLPASSLSGIYYLSFNMAITYADADEAAGTYVYPEVAIFINDVLQENLVFERKLQKKDNYDYGSIAGSGFVRINSSSDSIQVKLKEANGKDVLVVDANLNIIQLSSNDYTQCNYILELKDDAGDGWVDIYMDSNAYIEVDNNGTKHNITIDLLETSNYDTITTNSGDTLKLTYYSLCGAGSDCYEEENHFNLKDCNDDIVWSGTGGANSSKTLVANCTSTSTLPVEFVSMAYSYKKEELTWKTFSEINNDYFIIEIGSNFNEKGSLIITNTYSINGNGNTNFISYYSYPVNLNNKYVKLSQVDYDGKTTVLDLKYFSFVNNLMENTINIYPNPAKERSTIYINGKYNYLKIYDISRKEINLKVIDNKIIGLQKGAYLLYFNKIQNMKLIVY